MDGGIVHSVVELMPRRYSNVLAESVETAFLNFTAAVYAAPDLLLERIRENRPPSLMPAYFYSFLRCSAGGDL